ncbi:hypothetical protein [Methylomonas methanica]|nr:hypothetical protein [Methylomonas methanica]
MKNMTWRYGLLLAFVFWSGNNQASTLSTSGDIQVFSGGNLEIQTGQSPVDLRAKQPPSIAGGDIQILPRGSIEIQAGQTPINSGSISSSAIMLASGPAFLALPHTSGLTHIGDYFDVELLAFAPLANASSDELVLGFGVNTQLGGAGAAQFLGSTINSLFTDISTQDDVNLAAAGVAFPGLSLNEVGSLISLAVLHFQAVTAGTLNIAITSDLNDLNQGLIFLNQSPLAINAGIGVDITAVPLPPSLLMLVSGVVVSLGGIRRRRG